MSYSTAYWQLAHPFEMWGLFSLHPWPSRGDTFCDEFGQKGSVGRHMHIIIKRYWLLLRSGARFINLWDKYWLKIWTVRLFFLIDLVKNSDCHSDTGNLQFPPSFMFIFCYRPPEGRKSLYYILEGYLKSC